jgi:hypothetical protein
MRTGEAVALLFRLQTDGSQSVREIRRTRAEYVKEIRALETIGQRAITVLSSPVRGRLGFAGSLGISAARQALRSIANNEIKAVTDAQKQAADASGKLEAGLNSVSAAASLFTAKSLKQVSTLRDQANSFKFTRAEVELFEKSLFRANRALTSFAEDRSDRELRGTFKGLGVDRRLPPESALKQFARAYSEIGREEDRAGLATEVFGRNVDKILPKLEAARTSLLATESAAGGTAKGLLGVAAAAGPTAVAIGSVAVGLAAAAAAGTIVYAVLFSIAKATAEADATVAKLAETLGLSAENMSVLDVAARRTGREVTEIRESINIFNRNLGEAAAGNMPVVSDLLRGLGIDAKRAAADNDAALAQFIAAYNKLQNPTQRAAVLQKLFSDESGKVGAILREIGPDFEGYKKQLREAGLLMGEKAATDAKAFQRAMKELEIQLTSVRNNFGRHFVPEMTRGLRLINSEISGIGSAVSLVGAAVASEVNKQINQLTVLIALAKTAAQISPMSPGFGPALQTNTAQLIAEMNKGTGKSEADREADLANQQRRREAASRAYLGTLEASAEYQKQIEQGITAEVDRQLKLRQTSLESATRQRIAAARKLAETDTTVVRAQIAEEEQAELKQGETEANRQARIEALRVKERGIAEKFRSEELDAWADYQVRLREIEEQARADAIEAAETTARARIEALEAEIEKDESLREAHTRRIVEIERGITQVRLDELRKQAAAAGADVELRKRLQGEIKKAEAEASRQRAEQERRIGQAGLDTKLHTLRKSLLDEGRLSAQEAGRIATIRDDANRGATKFADAELQITNIVVGAINRRIKALEAEIKTRREYNEDISELTAQVKQLEQERQNAEEEGNRNFRDGLLEDSERLREQQDKIIPLEQSITAARIAARAAALVHLERTSGREIDVINERYQIEIDGAALSRDEAISTLRDREHAELKYWRKVIADDQKFYEKSLEIQKKFNELEALEEQRSKSEIDEIKRQRQREIELQDPLSARSLGGDVFADELSRTGSVLAALGATAQEVFHQMGESAGNMLSIVSGSISGVVQGLAGMVEQWALTGVVGPNALRKLAAATLASFAAQAIVKAIFSVAEGFSYMAKASAAFAEGNIFSGMLYKDAARSSFKAAAVWGLVGGAAAVAARGIAGDAFSGGGAGSGGGARREEDEGASRDTFSRDSRFAGESAGEHPFVRAARMMEAAVEKQRAATVQLTETTNHMRAVTSTFEGISPDDVITRVSADAFNDARERAFNSDTARYQDRILKPALGGGG